MNKRRVVSTHLFMLNCFPWTWGTYHLNFSSAPCASNSANHLPLLDVLSRLSAARYFSQPCWRSLWSLRWFFFFWGIYRLDFFVQSLLRKLSRSLKQHQLRTYTFVLSIQDRKHLHKGRRGSENISKVLLNHLVSYKSKVINFRCIFLLKELINNIYIYIYIEAKISF